MKHIIKLTFTLLTLTFLSLLAACNPLSEVHDRQYEDYAALAAAGEVERGWAPKFLPNSATNIHLKYDLDSNAILMAFDLPAADAEELARSCTARAHPLPPALTADWWPPDLFADPAASFYQCPQGYLALRGSSGFYWAGVQTPPDVIPVTELHAHPDEFLHLDGKQVTIVGYVDFDNIHDLRQSYYKREGIGFVAKPGQTADSIFHIYFPADANPHPLFDELYELRPTYEQSGLRLMATGVLRAYKQPTNFTNRTGYVMDVTGVDDVVILR